VIAEATVQTAGVEFACRVHDRQDDDEDCDSSSDGYGMRTRGEMS
jgi:hypothetical protein